MIVACPKIKASAGGRKEKTEARTHRSCRRRPPPLLLKQKKMSGPTPPRCPYAALGLPRSADASAIKRAFVEAAKRSHPDHLPASSSAAERAAAAARFAAVAEAYAVLGDASRRAAFDRAGGARGSVPSPASGGGSYYRPNGNAYNPYGGGFRPSSSSASAASYRAQQQRRPPSSSFFLSNLLRLVVARSSRGDAWAHVALAAAALGGAALAATAGDDLWRAANKGKLFDDVVAERDRRRRQRREEEGEGKGKGQERREEVERGSSACSASAPSPEPAPATSQTAAREASD